MSNYPFHPNRHRQDMNYYTVVYDELCLKSSTVGTITTKIEAESVVAAINEILAWYSNEDKTASVSKIHSVMQV